jgi:hypothetical protein
MPSTDPVGEGIVDFMVVVQCKFHFAVTLCVPLVVVNEAERSPVPAKVIPVFPKGATQFLAEEFTAAFPTPVVALKVGPLPIVAPEHPFVAVDVYRKLVPEYGGA